MEVFLGGSPLTSYRLWHLFGVGSLAAFLLKTLVAAEARHEVGIKSQTSHIIFLLLVDYSLSTLGVLCTSCF